MSLLLLIDGYNISQPIAPSRSPDPRWLEQIRGVLLRDLTTHLSQSLRRRTCVVFDAANPPRDRPSRFTHNEIDVQFAVDHLAADDLLEEIIRAHPTPKRLMVVSSDHRVQIAAKRRGAAHFDSQPWMDDLTDGKIHLAVALKPELGGAGQGGSPESKSHGKPAGPVKPRVEDPSEVADWMREFGFDD
ncbi:MAG: NYN domain-containing protein [Planctomycetales bacterium]|nr:NYN domain-containing protein [Planctomycetales bacterium]